MLLLYMINLIKQIEINREHLRAFLRNGEFYQIRTGDDIFDIWRTVMDTRADGWPMLQEPPTRLTRSDATRQPMQRDRSGVHGHRQLEALALLLECSVTKAGLSLRVSSAARKPSPFFVAAFSPTPARFVLLCPPRITTTMLPYLRSLDAPPTRFLAA